MLDAHCHLDDPRFDADRDAVIARAWAAGLTGIVVPGVTPDRWRHLPDLARQHPRIRIGFGLHPEALAQLRPAKVQAGLADLPVWLRDHGAACVGETGLDRRSAVPLPEQIRLTRAHLALAAELELPVVLHCVRAHAALLEVLEEHGPLRGLLHAYSGSAELVPRYLELGLHLSFGGATTWPEARRPLRALREVPAERLLLETDAPDQAPASCRGGRNEPGFLPEIAARVAEARGCANIASGFALGWASA